MPKLAEASIESEGRGSCSQLLSVIFTKPIPPQHFRNSYFKADLGFTASIVAEIR